MIKDKNWGRRKGGLNSKGTTKDIITPQNSIELAEFIGMILGDGHIQAYKKGKKIGVYAVKIAGDLNKDFYYHEKYIIPLVFRLFGLKAKLSKHRNNEVFTCIYSKKLVEFLEKHGLRSGNKIINQSTMPEWIRSDKEFIKACIRGLIDTDGSIFKMSKRDSHLFRISFTNYNKTLLSDTRNALITIGFHPSKIIKDRQIFLSRQSEIKRYINEVGFSNVKHLHKYYSPVV